MDAAKSLHGEGRPSNLQYNSCSAGQEIHRFHLITSFVTVRTHGEMTLSSGPTTSYSISSRSSLILSPHQGIFVPRLLVSWKFRPIFDIFLISSTSALCPVQHINLISKRLTADDYKTSINEQPTHNYKFKTSHDTFRPNTITDQQVGRQITSPFSNFCGPVGNLLNSTCCNTRWLKYDRDWFVCKQAAPRSSCANLREWSHNLHPPSCSG